MIIHQPGQIMGFTFAEVILYTLSGFMGNYCIVEGDTLIIKNHIWFWKHKKFDLSKLFSIDYLQLPNIGFSLKIKIKNAASGIHGINGISNANVIHLYHIFKKYNIKLTGFDVLDKNLT